MSTFTPGPWKVVRIDNTTLSIVAPWSAQVTPQSKGWGDYLGIHTATITHHSGDGAVSKEHAEANARLISAAPEMYDALQEAARVLSDLPSTNQAGTRTRAAWERAVAVLAKVDG